MTVDTDRPNAGTSVTEWAQEHGRPFAYTCALDNHEPTRRFAYSRGWFYTAHDGTADCVILDTSDIPDASRSRFLVDDGATVRAYYVAAFPGPNAYDDSPHVILHPFPTNYDADGNPRLRADDGRPVDFTSWTVGPAKTYHLKVRTIDLARDSLRRAREYLTSTYRGVYMVHLTVDLPDGTRRYGSHLDSPAGPMVYVDVLPNGLLRDMTRGTAGSPA